MQKVSIVILNYQVKKLALKCIKSVVKSDYNNLDIIVVDNNSGDEIEKDLKNGHVNFIQTGFNLGYSGGNNQGINKALANGADYVFILNPDTEISERCISELVKYAEEENADIVGPKIHFKNNQTIWFAGGIFDLQNVLGSHRGVNEIDNGQYEKVEETDFITGAAMMVRKEVFTKVGLLDERYFLYYEDSDFCFRAKQVGFKIMYIPSAVVFHENAKSTGLGSSLQDYYITRNRMLFASKFLSLRTKFALFKEALQNITMPVRRKALFDFLLGQFGKGDF